MTTRPNTRIETSARELRVLTDPPTAQETAVMRAATSLRKDRGLYRDLYSTEELQMLLSARRIAYTYGLVRLGRLLTVRTRRNKRRSPRIGSSEHECPKCGLLHLESRKMAKPTPSKLAEEKRLVEDALHRAQKARRGKRWIR